MKRNSLIATILVAVMCAFAVPANAQFGKSLKKMGKQAQKKATEAATEMGTEAAAKAVSKKLVEWMDTNNTILGEDSEAGQRLAKVTAKLINVGDYTLNYKVFEKEDEANIIATADGSMRIYSAMMDLLSNEELTAVIANQIGHLQAKDVRGSLMHIAKGENAEEAGAAQIQNLIGGKKIGTVINEILQFPYTDEQNKKADEYAVSLLEKKGFEADALVSALNKFAPMEANDKKIDASEEEDSEEEIDEDAETSIAYKFIKVNSNNAERAEVIEAM